MREVFTEIINMSISASFLIAACILVRFLFKQMPKYIRCLIWILVGVRLLVPFTIESPFSLLPAREYVVDMDSYGENINSQEISDNSLFILNSTDSEITNLDKKTFDKGLDEMDIFSLIWIIGFVLTIVYALSLYLNLKKCISDAIPVKNSVVNQMVPWKNVYESERIDTAFVIGIINPRIYIPSGLDKTEMFMILNHEIAHYKRGDHLAKPIGFFIVAMHWFNPAVWIAYSVFCKDIELACDEKVIRKIGYDKKKIYSQTLLDMSIPRRMISACPVAFGEIGTKERVKNIINMEKNKKIIVAMAFLVLGALTVGFLTYPHSGKVDAAQNIKNDKEPSTSEQIDNEPVVSEQVDKKSDSQEQVDQEVDADIQTGEVFCFPISDEKAIITCQFGEKHKGTDFCASDGTEIVSVCAGSVEEAGFKDDLGNYVIIKGDDGTKYLYAHMLDELMVAAGDEVKKGQKIGAVGNSGNSTGPHLHLGVINTSGEYVDPLSVISEQ